MSSPMRKLLQIIVPARHTVVVPGRRKPFRYSDLIPEKSAGLRDTALDEAAGFVKGVSIFVHKDRFIGGFKSMNWAVEFARKCAEEGGWKK